ncbi:uncharacterized protein LOC118435100 [Folsomia candida]|uniref:uncharacterized protein LOC118435100 n=1 Tax=Folsomia candida TaxID=158441 RepID=UPI0016052118|nr:uncharacterized protein LOC118435100 [Folsomia candida]
MDPSGEDMLESEKPGPIFGWFPSFKRGYITNAIKEEYYQIVDNPKRLPFFLHPIVSREREFTISGKQSFFTPSIYLKDHVNVPRRIYLNFDTTNLAVGATGGLLIGLGTQHYFKTYGRLAQLTSQTWLKRVELGTATGVQRFAYGSIVATRIAKRALMGAVLFDLLKRNAEKERGKDDWMNPAFAGFFCGAAFGLRGGFHTGIIGAFGFSMCSTLHHFFPSLSSI